MDTSLSDMVFMAPGLWSWYSLWVFCEDVIGWAITFHCAIFLIDLLFTVQRNLFLRASKEVVVMNLSGQCQGGAGKWCGGLMRTHWRHPRSWIYQHQCFLLHLSLWITAALPFSMLMLGFATCEVIKTLRHGEKLATHVQPKWPAGELLADETQIGVIMDM